MAKKRPPSAERGFVGGPGVSAILGLNPWMSRYRYWHQLKGTIECEDLSTSPPIVIGAEVESGIVRAAKRLYSIDIRQVHRYTDHPTLARAGGSLDAEMRTEKHGWVPVEAKMIDRMYYNRQWKQPDGSVEMAPHYRVQLQWYTRLENKPFGMLLGCIGGNELVMIPDQADRELWELMDREVALFLESVDAGEEPPPDYVLDFDVMKMVHTNTDPGKVLVIESGTDFERMLTEYCQLDDLLKNGEGTLTELKARMLLEIGEYEKATHELGTISAKLQPPKKERTVPVTYKAKPATRGFRIYRR